MSFSNMLEILQEKNKNKIVLIKTGVFYIATGKDAIYLNKEIGLKCICFKNQICKVGVPEGSIENYIKKLEELKLGYIVYELDREKEELIVKYKGNGKYHNEMMVNKNCLICKGIKNYKEDKYMNALQKIFEEGLNEE